MTNTDFWQWIERELEVRRLTYHGIEREQGLSNAAISRPARNRTEPSLTACKALSEALQLPLVSILRMAGHLPPKSTPDSLQENMLELFALLNENNQRRALELLQMMVDSQLLRGRRDADVANHAPT
jgi:transcriptional regulator with XRE-family HTH domain